MYKEIQKDSDAKSYIYWLPASSFMVEYLAFPHIWSCTRSILNFLLYEEFFSLFYQFNDDSADDRSKYDEDRK